MKISFWCIIILAFHAEVVIHSSCWPLSPTASGSKVSTNLHLFTMTMFRKSFGTFNKPVLIVILEGFNMQSRLIDHPG